MTNIQKVTGINISPSGSVTKNIGENFTISVSVSPSDANNKTINWDSSNKYIATVDSNGKISCLAAGSTTITATAADGSGVSASITLTVRNPINSLTLDKDQTTILKDGYTSTVTVTTDPSNYDGANISWTIADTSIATVTVSGKTATIKSTSKIGQTTLTVSAGGFSKTVNISVVNFVTTTYEYTGSVQQVDLPAGTYKLEVWGAQGGTGTSKSTYSGGKGGYSVGTIALKNSITCYIYVGGKGNDNIRTESPKGGGWNGGGNAAGNGESNTEYASGGGGGATDISLYGTNNSPNWNNVNHLYSRIIVAGGGGGFSDGWSASSTVSGHGGGFSGSSSGWGNTGGTQTSGGTVGSKGGNIPNYIQGAFGIAGYINDGAGNNGGAGAGSGWYGGGVGHWSAGGGGSGYVYTSNTASNYPSGCLLNSSYYLTNAQTISGNQSFPNVAGTGNETGHSGNGAAKITPVN